MSQVLLDQVQHARIIQDFENVCSTAGIQGRFMYKSMVEFCAEKEVDWVKNFRRYEQEGLPGVVLEKVKRPDTRCQAICAALLRNFIDARVVPLNTLLDSYEDGQTIKPHVLIIPNLYISSVGKTLPSWKVQVLYDILLERAARQKPTVVYSESLQGMQSAYGVPFADFISSFMLITQ